MHTLTEGQTKVIYGQSYIVRRCCRCKQKIWALVRLFQVLCEDCDRVKDLNDDHRAESHRVERRQPS